MLSFLLAGISRYADWADVPGLPWKKVIASVMIGQAFVNVYISYRQIKVLQDKTIPEEAKPLIKDQAHYEKSVEYQIAKRRYSIVSKFYNLAIALLTYHVDAYPLFWQGASRAVAWLGYSRFSGEASKTAMLVLLTAPIDPLSSLPLKLYYQFVLEEKFGFNNMTLGLFVKDTVKGIFLSAAITGPLMAGIVKVINYFGDSFIVYTTLLISAFSVIMIVVYPVFIQPMFNTYTPLEDGSLKNATLELTNRFNFPLKELYVEDSSTRSSHSNAYFTGLPWFKRVVICDSLIEKNSEAEVIGVLAHELGHWKRNHIAQSLFSNMGFMLFMLSIFAAFRRNSSVFEDFKFAPGHLPVIIALTIFNDAWQALELPTGIWMSWTTRVKEYDADKFAAEHGYGEQLCSALTHLQSNEMAEIKADKLYSLYVHSHPLIADRIAAIKKVPVRYPLKKE